MDKIEFPVATCPVCKVRGPVYIHDWEADIRVEQQELPIKHLKVQVIICPECDIIINSEGDIELEWFDIEDAKYFGYKVVENE